MNHDIFCAKCRGRGVTLRLGQGGGGSLVTRYSIIRGTENNFAPKLFIIIKNVFFFGGGGVRASPRLKTEIDCRKNSACDTHEM